MPLRRLLPPAGRVDAATVAALLLVQFAKTALLSLLASGGLSLVAIVVHGLRDLAHTVLQFYFVVVLVYALLSWLAPGSYSAGAQLLGRLAEPLLRPLRRVLPPIGGLDFSALFVLIGLQALQILLR
jgi:YggT family protein